MERAPFRPTARPREPSDAAPRVAFPEKVKNEVARRYRMRCALGLPGCSGLIQEFHHRRLRSQGGLGLEENCLPLCLHCHGTAHSRRDWAHRHGIIVSSQRDPAEVGVYTRCDLDCLEEHT